MPGWELILPSSHEECCIWKTGIRGPGFFPNRTAFLKNITYQGYCANSSHINTTTTRKNWAGLVLEDRIFLKIQKRYMKNYIEEFIVTNKENPTYINYFN
jgi:hypothetical protein